MSPSSGLQADTGEEVGDFGVEPPGRGDVRLTPDCLALAQFELRRVVRGATNPHQIVVASYPGTGDNWLLVSIPTTGPPAAYRITLVWRP
jgi:hypothetical protein